MGRVRAADCTRAPLRQSRIINGNGHLFGRLASVVAKQLLRGERITVLRAEGINISGKFHRTKTNWMKWHHKKVLTNPKKGPFHWRTPGHMFTRCVRGMIPYNTRRGAWCMRRLKVLEGVPRPFDTKKAYVVPRALRKMRLNPARKFSTLGRLAHEVGWKHQDTVARLETKRKEKAAKRHEEQNKLRALHKQATEKATPKLAKQHADVLKAFGYMA
eukprot:NODE_1428_length_1420_cov_109.349380_g1188_i0.p1 GENE.NODE_1428_length_1420_cov_109.349380_g1188_i0~~NODE_1428_length_1420_cov_109.349380_g1188_i0.p1  ORF type:complete len:216 (+),score=87.21 NODE_1428_length_1420_cov_109.349380_g1188_i0:103-750(+)